MPQGNKDTLVKKAQHMYHEISKETGEFFDFMADHELFDLETKPGKRQGGYCTFIEGYNAPFIFSNFNGTSADVDVLTHEAGHAFEVYTAAPAMPIPSMVFPTMEIAEIHSMSMELWTYPWMENFFGDKAEEYRKEHGEAPEWMPNQYFAALTNMRSVGVMGDERTYDYAVALRAVNTVDFMTAESAEIPFAVLQTVMSRIINEVRGVNRVFYDLTSKPPGTIEFE